MRSWSESESGSEGSGSHWWVEQELCFGTECVCESVIMRLRVWLWIREFCMLQKQCQKSEFLPFTDSRLSFTSFFFFFLFFF